MATLEQTPGSYRHICCGCGSSLKTLHLARYHGNSLIRVESLGNLMVRRVNFNGVHRWTGRRTEDSGIPFGGSSGRTPSIGGSLDIKAASPFRFLTFILL